jgi:membrane protein
VTLIAWHDDNHLQIRELIGEQGAKAIESMIRSARTERLGVSGILLTLIPWCSASGGSSGSFRTGSRPGRGVVDMLRKRFLSFAMVVGIGFLLLVSLALSAWLVAVGTYFGQVLPAPAAALEALNFVTPLR